jgi:hypothetical protein
VLDTITQKTKDEHKQNNKTQRNKCWTPPYT